MTGSHFLHVEDSDKVAEKNRKALNLPIVLAGCDGQILPSIGTADYPEDATDLARLLRNADEAMYSVKKSGCNGFPDQAVLPRPAMWLSALHIR